MAKEKIILQDEEILEEKIILQDEESLEDKNAALELKIAEMEGAALKAAPAKPVVPAKALTVAGKKYKWLVATFVLNAETIEAAAASKEVIEQLVAMESGLLVLQD